MALSRKTLAKALQRLTPSATELGAIQAFADAIEEYALDAQALTDILPAGVTLGKLAMIGPMTGLSASGAAAVKYTAGLRAFWVGVAGGLDVSFLGAKAITPPPFTGFEAIIQAVFVDNIANERDLENATDAMATAIHSATIVGGLVQTPPAIITPII